MGGSNATKGNRAAALLVGKSSKDGWDITNYSPLCMEGESKVSKLKDKKQITPCWGGGGWEVRIFLCAIFHNQFYK